MAQELPAETQWTPMKYWLSSVGQVQSHDAVVGFEHSGVGGEVGRRPRVGLDVDAPQRRVQVKGFQRPFLTQQLDLVDDFGATIISAWREEQPSDIDARRDALIRSRARRAFCVWPNSKAVQAKQEVSHFRGGDVGRKRCSDAFREVKCQWAS